MAADGVPRPEHAAGDTISRNAIFAFAAQVSTAAFTAALTIFLTRELGPAGFGTFALAVSVTGLIRRTASGGTSPAAARFVAERHGDTAAVVGVLGMSLRLRALSATAIAVVLFALSEPIAALYDAPELVWPIRGMALALIGQSLVQFFTTIFSALRAARGAFVVVFGEAAMEFSATVSLVLLSGGATAAAFGRVVGYTFGAALGLVLLTRLLSRSPLFRTGASPVARRRFMNYAGAMLIVGTASAVFAQVDVLLVGAFLTTSAVGIYSAPLRLISLFGYPGQALAQGVAPRLARHPDARPSLEALVRALRYVIVLQAGLMALMLAWAEPIVRLLLGPEFSESAEVLRALAPFAFMAGLGPLLAQPLNYAGEGRRRVPVGLATVGLVVGLDVILIPAYGVVGAAVATDLAYALYAGCHLWLSRSTLGLPLRPLGASAGRALFAAAGGAGVLIIAGTGDLSPAAWVTGLVGGTAVFLALLHAPVGCGSASS